MPICINCTTPVTTLYTSYSKADDRSAGKGVRLTQCPSCLGFADKYVEHDFVVVFIDLVLVKPGVLRHLLFNRFGSSTVDGASSGGAKEGSDAFDPSMIRLAVLLLLFDVYLTWARVERETPVVTHTTSPFLRSAHTAPDSSSTIMRQYSFFFTLCLLQTLALHLPIRLLLSAPRGLLARMPFALWLPEPYPWLNCVSTALLISAATPKMFPILMLIWPANGESVTEKVVAQTYGVSANMLVEYAVLGNNVAALQILLGCRWVQAIVLVAIGATGRELVGWWMLSSVGLWGNGTGVVGGLLGIWEVVKQVVYLFTTLKDGAT